MKRMWVSSKVVLATALWAGGCALEDEDPAHTGLRNGELDSGGTIIDPGDDDQSAGGDDGGGGRTGGDWIFNGLGAPSSAGVNPSYALSSPLGLNVDDWDDDDDDGDDDDEDGVNDSERLIRYVVECALDHDDGVTVEVDDDELFLPGKVGLAPQWRDGPCDVECQKWVSACLLARVNAAGDEHEIFVQGDNPALGFGEDPAFPLYEGTFFGNVFADPPALHACRGDAAAATVAASIGRSCTLDADDCGFTVHSDCTSAAGCALGPTGVATIDCQPVAGGPSYPGISVNIRQP